MELKENISKILQNHAILKLILNGIESLWEEKQIVTNLICLLILNGIESLESFHL